jgi:hypothetical protein
MTKLLGGMIKDAKKYDNPEQIIHEPMNKINSLLL